MNGEFTVANRSTTAYDRFKAVADRIAALGMLTLFAPLMLIVAALVAQKLGRPVLFRQQRPGKDGRLFELLKFRTMSCATGADDRLLPDSNRLTPFGQTLRRWSLDELPQLFNVLRGDMSLVGPRPLLPQYLERYSPEQARRHGVRPGVTGWAQVNGRNAIDWNEKFALDCWYVDHRSLGLDIRILWLTVLRVARRSGISAANEATMPEFMGSTSEAT